MFVTLALSYVACAAPPVAPASAVTPATTVTAITVTPELTSLEKQQASLGVQRESVQRQLSTIRPRYASGSSRSIHASSIPFTTTAFEPVEMPPFPFPPAAQIDCPAISKLEVDGLIGSAARKEDLSPALLRAVIKRESAFHPCAVSERGALGLMQLMPATAEQFGVADPFDPRQNVRGGAAFLKQLLNRFGGNIRLALSAYNAGPERVDAAGGIPDILETQNYVTAIAGDLGLPELPATAFVEPPAVTEADATPEGTNAEPTNAMPKPDLRHLTLASPGLTFTTKPTPVHLTSSQ